MQAGHFMFGVIYNRSACLQSYVRGSDLIMCYCFLVQLCLFTKRVQDLNYPVCDEFENIWISYIVLYFEIIVTAEED